AAFGSEGQLGVVTSVTLQVDARPAVARPHLVLFDDTREALAFAKVLTASKVAPAHILFESANRLVIANQLMGQQHLRPANAVLVSVEGEESEKAFADFMKGTGLSEEKEYLARLLWNERFFPMKVRRLGPGMMGTEIVMPSGQLMDSIAAVRKLCSKLAIDPMFEVHFLADGRSLLLCFFTVDQGNTMGYTLASFESLLLSRLLIDMGGKPYSMGIWNMPFSDAEDRSHMKLVRDAKTRLDPKGVMNSGKFFYLSGRFGPLGSAVLHPRIMRPLLRTVIAFSPLSTKLIRFVGEFARRRLRPESRTDILRTADECAMCGACVPVCPAYLMLGDERVTARGKLQTAKAISGGMPLSKEHAHRTFLCMRCKACEQVCQSKLDLIPIYEKLEAQLERAHGRDAKEIEAFVRAAEASPEYDELVCRGLVLGAPRHGTGGVKPDV
ncbi:MAG: 4Fe-4S dicluster domain-containing protein, partial [Thermoplasmata archaeon]|nr:4Fe-4S dicluster domain-containing protein [Thermoplasmata archaeon]